MTSTPKLQNQQFLLCRHLEGRCESLRILGPSSAFDQFERFAQVSDARQAHVTHNVRVAEERVHVRGVPNVDVPDCEAAELRGLGHEAKIQ